MLPISSASGFDRPQDWTIWDEINSRSIIFRDLVMITGDAAAMDTCTGSSAFYTVFVPDEEFLNAYFAREGLDILDFSAEPILAENLVGDHMANGFIAPNNLEIPDFAFVTTLTGRKFVRSTLISGDPPVFYPDEDRNIYLNRQFVAEYHAACNGAVYFLNGPMYQVSSVSVAGKSAFDPFNTSDASRGASRPTRQPLAVTTELPETR